MSVQEVVQQVSYVTSPSGKPTAVQVQIEVWEQIVSLLQQTWPAIEMATVITDAQEEVPWDLFLTLADAAQPGALTDPSLNHDSYLYGGVA